MPSISAPVPDTQLLKRRLGGYVVRGNHEAADGVRRELKTARVEKHIIEAVAEWPPITPEQREKLARLLNGGGAK